MKKILILSFSILLSVSGIAADTSRVLIEFKPGKKAETRGLVRNANATIHHEFDDLNALAATLPTRALAGIRNNPNVVLVEIDPPRYLLADSVPYGIDLVQATAVWDSDNNGIIDASAPTGAGIKVGVIDSGIFTSHEDFAGVSITGEPAGWNTDGLGHGTHVSGTIAAALNGTGVVGVSPGKVALHMVKVFGSGGEWIYASSLINAANRCKAAGCKVISMSLGGGTPSRTEDRGFQNLYNKSGILSIAAAGNAGDTTISYPAGYASVVSVAAIDVNKQLASFSQQNSDVELSAPGVNVLSTVPFIDSNTVVVGGTTVSGNHIENAARGTASGTLVDGGLGDSANPAWAGKVVLVQRGNISFLDKVKNVENSGGVACVIYNNAAGNFYGTLGAGNSSVIPAITISGEDGTLLGNFVNQAATLSSSITPGSAYAYYDGTSMATPHVSAAAALIWSARPTKSNAQVRTALQVTAEDLGPVAGRDASFGYGLIQAKTALDYLLSH